MPITVCCVGNVSFRFIDKYGVFGGRKALLFKDQGSEPIREGSIVRIPRQTNEEL